MGRTPSIIFGYFFDFRKMKWYDIGIVLTHRLKTYGLSDSELVKAGFQKRQDAYSGMLGYVIYQDGKGIIQK